ncbi:MAG: 50S ribosomal protein L10 [Campylobacterales bacterium]|nr:50S ribosomal protein L10 [Campylobacterales bacterium]
MDRVEKARLIDELSEEFKNAKSVVVCNYKGMTVKQLEDLRNEARKKNVKVRVIKNTLAGIALKSAGIEEYPLKETNMFIWGEDLVGTCKVASDYTTVMKDKYEIRFGFIEGKFADLATVEKYAKLPSKEELIGMLLSVWTAPARYFVTGLDNLKQKLEQN